MTEDWVQQVLGRPEWDIPIVEPLDKLDHEEILITGAAGSIGQALCATLERGGVDFIATDIDTLDVRDFKAFEPYDQRWTLAFHLAAAKHAPHGEDDPVDVARTNTIGTANLLDWSRPGSRVVLASTCKAADPETAYGASKLLAERMVLNQRGTVARFYNVVESSGNVFELWRNQPSSEPLRVAHCERYFISLREAVALVLWSAVLSTGRYTLNPGMARSMPRVASSLFPGRATVDVSRRRGDRRAEPLHALSELRYGSYGEPLCRIVSPHDLAA